MEQVYLIAKKVAVALVQKHKAAWKERNRHLAENDLSVRHYQTRDGSPTTWGYSSGDEEDKPELRRQERGCSRGREMSEEEETNSQPVGDQGQGGSHWW